MISKRQSLDKISKYSSHLSGKLDRLALDLDYKLIADSFYYSIESGGIKELGFKRPAGQSFNPRPARVAIILIDSKVPLTSELLAASFIVCLEIIPKDFEKDIERIANRAKLLIENRVKEYSLEELHLALALHLDDARHFHLSSAWEDHKSHDEMILKSQHLLRYSSEESMYLGTQLSHWFKRYRR